MPDIRGLVCFDLDGTLLRGPTVCEVIADALGRSEAMQRFETFSTEVEIAAARVEMARWYAGHSQLHLQKMCARAQWAPGARECVALLQARGVEVVIASITWRFAVAWFASQLKVDRYLGTELLGDGGIEHVWGATKGHWLATAASELGVSSDKVGAVGDSPSDAALLSAAALRFYVGILPPYDVSDVICLPAADIRWVAERVLSDWGLT